MRSLVIRHGESEADLLDVHEGRADYVLSKIISDTAPDTTIAIVTHGDMINQLYRSFLRLPIDSDIFFGTGDTGIHSWYLDEKSRRVLMANYTNHTNGI